MRCLALLLVACASATQLTSLRGGASKEKVTIIGSGNWGSAIAKIIARNVLDRDEFDTEVKMWVYEEQVDGRNLTEIINEECAASHRARTPQPSADSARHLAT